MGKLVLVRHGQASFFGPNYDQLSAVGERQACLLGDYWARRRVRFHQVYTGPCARQIETARLVGEAYGRAGLPWPKAVVVPELDEFQAEAVVSQGLPPLLEKDERLRELHRNYENEPDQSERLKKFQRMYELLIQRWVEGEVELPGVESWEQFCARVERGVSRMVAVSGLGRELVAFTSGGPIGVALQRALRTARETTLQLVWMVRNASFSEFWFSDNRFTLSVFNAFFHLEDPSLETFR